MRRSFVLVLAAGLLGSAIGCKHVAGICDCQTFGYSGLCCYGGHGCGAGSAPAAPPPVPTWSGPVPPNWGTPPVGEPLRQMPQAMPSGGQPTLPAPTPGGNP